MLTKSIKTRVATFCGAALLTFAMGAPASAGIIFEDDFSRTSGAFVGNGWDETEQGANDVGIGGATNGFLRLRDNIPSGSAAQIGLSTLGFENITISFDFRRLNNNTDAGDDLILSINTGSGFLDIASYGLGSSTYQTITLGLAADDLALFEFAFTVDVNANNEGARVDNVLVTGDKITTTNAVPEPGTMALFGLGLVGLGYARRRKSA